MEGKMCSTPQSCDAQSLNRQRSQEKNPVLMEIRIRINLMHVLSPQGVRYFIEGSQIVFALQRRRQAALSVWVKKKQAQNVRGRRVASRVESREPIEDERREEKEEEKKVEWKRRNNRLLASRVVRSKVESGTRLAVSLKCWLLRAMPC